MKRAVIEAKADLRHEGRAQRRYSTEPKHRGGSLADAQRKNPKVRIKPGTKDERALGANSTKSNKPR
jgi:hypothetical protein